MRDETSPCAATPRVLVLVVTWNKRNAVSRLLEQLETRTQYRSFDILVVDNASTDGTVSLLQERFPAVRVLQNPTNLGGAGGFNAGLRWALAQGERYRHVWLLDNDAQLDDDALSPLVEATGVDGHIGAAGSAIVTTEDPGVLNELGGRIRRAGIVGCHAGESVANLGRDAENVDYVASCSALITVTALRAAGIMAEEFFLYYDDVDLCSRIRRAGFGVVATGASRVGHPSFGEKHGPLQLYFYARNSLQFFLVREPHRRARSLLLLALRHARGIALAWTKWDRRSIDLLRGAQRDFLAGRLGASAWADRVASTAPHDPSADWAPVDESELASLPGVVFPFTFSHHQVLAEATRLRSEVGRVRAFALLTPARAGVFRGTDVEAIVLDGRRPVATAWDLVRVRTLGVRHVFGAGAASLSTMLFPSTLERDTNGRLRARGNPRARLLARLLLGAPLVLAANAVSMIARGLVYLARHRGDAGN